MFYILAVSLDVTQNSRNPALVARTFRFAAVGIFSAIVQTCTITLAKHHFSSNTSFSICFIASTATHYLLNRFWALKSIRTDSLKQFIEYLGTVCLSYLINITVFHLAHDFAHLDITFAALVAIPPSTIFVFLLLHIRVFRSSKSRIG